MYSGGKRWHVPGSRGRGSFWKEVRLELRLKEGEQSKYSAKVFRGREHMLEASNPGAKEGNSGAGLEGGWKGKRTLGDSQFSSLNSNDSRIIYAEIWCG